MAPDAPSHKDASAKAAPTEAVTVPDLPTSPGRSEVPLALNSAQKGAIFGVFASFYKDLVGQWNTTLLVDIWQGPNAIMVQQLEVDPMPPAVAKSMVAMLATITQASPHPSHAGLTLTGALERLYDLAFDGAERLDLLAYADLPRTALSEAERTAWVRCCITMEPLERLVEPMVIRTAQGVHLFEWQALRQAFRDGFRFINPMTRQAVHKDALMRLKG